MLNETFSVIFKHRENDYDHYCLLQVGTTFTLVPPVSCFMHWGMTSAQCLKNIKNVSLIEFFAPKIAFFCSYNSDQLKGESYYFVWSFKLSKISHIWIFAPKKGFLSGFGMKIQMRHFWWILTIQLTLFQVLLMIEFRLTSVQFHFSLELQSSYQWIETMSKNFCYRNYSIFLLKEFRNCDESNWELLLTHFGIWKKLNLEYMSKKSKSEN